MLLCGLASMNERDLAGCLKYGAGAAVEGDSRFDAGLFGEAVDCLFEGVGAVSLLMRAGGLARSTKRAAQKGNRNM